MKSCNDEKNCNKKFNRKGNKMKKRIYVKSNLAVLVVFLLLVNFWFYYTGPI